MTALVILYEGPEMPYGVKDNIANILGSNGAADNRTEMYSIPQADIVKILTAYYVQKSEKDEEDTSKLALHHAVVYITTLFSDSIKGGKVDSAKFVVDCMSHLREGNYQLKSALEIISRSNILDAKNEGLPAGIHLAINKMASSNLI